MINHADRGASVDTGQALAQRGEGRFVHQVTLAHQQAVGETDLRLGDGLGQVQVGMCRVDQRDDAVEDIALAQLFVDEKGLCHRCRIGQAGAFDHQAVEGDVAPVQTLEQQIKRFSQVRMDGAADAPVGQCHHLYRFIAQQLGIDTGIAEFVLDHGNFQAVLGLEQVTQQSGLASAEEAAEDRDRDGRGQN
ncbi:hypothetical protein D3C87_1467250 [compost metagenome]